MKHHGHMESLSGGPLKDFTSCSLTIGPHGEQHVGAAEIKTSEASQAAVVKYNNYNAG